MTQKHRKLNIDWSDEKQSKEYHRQYRLAKRLERIVKRDKKNDLLFSLVRNLDSNAIAYIAGLFDGEGSVCITKSNQELISKRYSHAQHTLTVSITNQYRPVLEYVKNVTGLGNIYPTNKGSRTLSWQVNQTRAMEFLKAICNSLIIKKQQATLAIKFQEEVSSRNLNPKNMDRFEEIKYLTNEDVKWRDDIKEEMSRLNHSYHLA